MFTLAGAIEEGHWELVACCLVLGLAEAISRLPADAASGMVDVIDGGEGVEKKS